MNVAILHYHFDRGGVTRVVSSTLEAFQSIPEVHFGVLSGRPVDCFSVPCAVLPQLNYSAATSHEADQQALYRDLREAGRKLFHGSDPDVWHIHNPALGKNTAFSYLVHQLIREGCAVLLHEHDFAEDFRPKNYQLRESSRPPEVSSFPYSPRARYAVLNQRDASILRQAGLPSKYLFQLPNPVPVSSPAASPNPQSDLILYPVRALARKNLGEFLLLAHTYGSDLRWESTLPPTNSAYEPRFRQWCSIAEDLEIPARLGVAAFEDKPFEDRLIDARAIVTTSVAEGFGLSFLEPWTLGRPVFGRDLPEITGEFRSAGIQLDSFYSSFLIPAAAVDRTKVADLWLKSITSAYAAFEMPPPVSELAEYADQIRSAEMIDFALLGESLQMEALNTIVSKKIPIETPVEIPVSFDPGILSNREKIIKEFSPGAYAQSLLDIYKTLTDSSPAPSENLDPASVLKSFLHPSRFHPHFVE
tara:strand:+ start:8384 stop:9805 length:1422 start_codon:yes stop_codon:yes gene_type:complete